MIGKKGETAVVDGEGKAVLLAIAADLVQVELVVLLARQFALQAELQQGIGTAERAQAGKDALGGCGTGLRPEIRGFDDKTAQAQRIDGDMLAPAQAVRGNTQKDEAGGLQIVAFIIAGEIDMLGGAGDDKFPLAETAMLEAMGMANQDIAKSMLVFDAALADQRPGMAAGSCAFDGSMQDEQRDGSALDTSIDVEMGKGIAGRGPCSKPGNADEHTANGEKERLEALRGGVRRGEIVQSAQARIALLRRELLAIGGQRRVMKAADGESAHIGLFELRQPLGDEAAVAFIRGRSIKEVSTLNEEVDALADGEVCCLLKGPAQALRALLAFLRRHAKGDRAKMVVGCKNNGKDVVGT